jgi:hypothetical protein
MKIEIRETKENGLVQITTLDERWYYRQEDKKIFPSSTWIAGYYPKGTEFYKWLASKEWDEAQAIRNAAGDKGSKIHNALDLLIMGNDIEMNTPFKNPSTEQYEELTVEEWEAVMSFVAWWKEVKPERIASEQAIFNEEYNYAGTMDLLCKIDNEVWLIDFKTSQHVWAEHELQISSYKHCLKEKVDKLGILRIGYRMNKRRYKLNEVDDKFDLFLAARQIWEHENAKVSPKQYQYPTKLSLKEN